MKNKIKGVWEKMSVPGRSNVRSGGVVGLLAALLISPVTAVAQEAEPRAYLYAAYYVCDVANQLDMDRLVEEYEKPVFDQKVQDGDLMAWGYLSHSTGGKWRRAQFHSSETLAGALGAQVSVFNEIYSAENAGALQERAEACEAHDDYIWVQMDGSPVDAERGNVSVSVYEVCDRTREARADEIFSEIFAPRLNKLAESGAIVSWNRLNHYIGGPYRRLLTVTGHNQAENYLAYASMGNDLNDSERELQREYLDICGVHDDYLWDIVH